MKQRGNTANHDTTVEILPSKAEHVRLDQGHSIVCTCECHNKSTLKCLTVACVVSCLVCIVCLVAIVSLITLNSYRADFPCEFSVSTSPQESTPSKLAYKDSADSSELDGKDGPFERVDRDVSGKRNNTRNRRQGKNRHCKGKGRKRCKGKKGPKGDKGERGEQGEKGDKGEKGERGEKGDSAGPLLAAHFRSNFDGHEKLQFMSEDRCVNLPNSPKSFVCRNRTVFFPINTSYTFLHPARWVDPDKNPLQEVSDGVYEVRYTGVYLVYSTVSFYDAQIKLYYSIKVNGKSKLTCSDGVDHVESEEFGKNIRHKSCSVTGVLNLSKNDKIELQNLSANSRIDITKDRTFFGVVLLSIYED